MFARLAVLVLIGLCGCVSTYHAEHSRVTSSTVDTCGSMSCSDHASQDARHWQGPWLGQPDGIRP